MTVLDDMVIDGWHRYSACVEIGIPCRTEDFEGGDPATFVISKNTHRRQLSASQKAAAVVAVREWRPAGNPDKFNPAAAAGLKAAATEKQMAKEANVGERTIRQAKLAHKAGLGEAVRDGKVSAEKAAA